MKCDNCIHKRVCKDKPPESYPQFMINIMTDSCEYYINSADIQPDNKLWNVMTNVAVEQKKMQSQK